MFHSREKAYSHRKNREDFLGGLEASKQEKLRPIENYMSEEMKVIQNHLNAEIAKEASRLKNEVANKWNAILASQTQTSLRGASSSTLRDKYRMGLLQHKKGSFAGELFRYAQQYITTPYSMLLNAYDMYQASKTGAEASMRLAGIERQYITTVILSGIATATIKALLRGEDPTSKGVVVDGILTNGALIPYGDKLYSLLLEKDGLGILGSAPSVVANATSAIKKGLTGEKGASVAGIRTVRNVIPFMNLWYIKGAFDHLILNSLLEWANPGYNERSQKNQEKHGKRFFWDKNSPLPNRMPEANLW
ncbi:hypothetical protein AYJ09_04235 [Candidatus Liberibacter solanacearum]|uniref:hypothetical protein n=1 Tax=Candidatus Liberibacter solanacearum TaxID=556287 RepID=UPI00097900E3|nr:hypothetical protein [Candidatus Liberibacter solanacearum]ONI59522.1 hypothetical protein AYJ09_04235 [Candidatus Liberibacter solanacearum]